jgi:hypothetical protein
MSEPSQPSDRRQGERRGAEAPASAAGPKIQLPVVAGLARSEDVREAPRRGFGAFAAQILGQGGQKRGLRGGPETLDHARATYLETEWSGPADRRPSPGRITKTEI